MTVTAGVERVTPAQARDWVKNHNFINRKIRERTVTAYRKDIENGRWQIGQPVEFDINGNLLNGQHRLTALSYCEKTRPEGVDFIVVRGLPPESGLMMDQGISRNIADMLKQEAQEGIKNVSTVAAICRWLVLCPEPDHEFQNKLKNKASAARCLDMYRSDPKGITRASELAHAVRTRSFPMSVAATGYCYYLFRQLDVEKAEQYFWSWQNLSWGAEGDPRKAAYMRASTILSDPEQKHGPTLTTVTVSLMTRSWNAWRDGVEMDTILPRDGKRRIIPPEVPH